MSRSGKDSKARPFLLALGALTIAGLALRLSRFGQTIMGDELSTLYIVTRNGLADTVGVVSGDAEISPPLYFTTAWLATQLGAADELIRLPSLIAGTLSIPLVYLVGARAVGRGAGLIAAAVMALSPFMIFYSTDGRTYALAIALLLGSTLTMLIALQRAGIRWWVLFGALSCLAMYTHYTSAFVLLGQLGWLFWAHPEARRAAVLANLGAAVAYLPWLPSTLADFDSPTVDILSALQGSGFAAKRLAVESWVAGYPYLTPSQFPGRLALVLLAAGMLVALASALTRAIQARASAGASARPPLEKGVVLVLVLALATPVAEALLLVLGGTDLFGARNLNTSSAGLALSIGAVLASAGPIIGAVCTVAVLGAFAFGAAKTLDGDSEAIQFDSAAGFIESRARPGDVVVDALSWAVTPVPLTPLDLHLSPGFELYKLLLPTGPPPFLPFESTPLPPVPQLREAFRAADSRQLFLIGSTITLDQGVRGRSAFQYLGGATTEVTLPAGSRVVEEREYPGVRPIRILVIDPGPDARGPR